MSMASIRAWYKVPVRRFGRVEYTGNGTTQQGKILGVSKDGAWLRIRLDGEKYVGNYHPTDCLRYLDEK
jgi:hypothetical protein